MPPVVRSNSLEIRADGFIRRLLEERDYVESLEKRVRILRKTTTEAQKQLSKKEDELTVAKIEIFHLKHRPTNLKAVMASFNREFVHCRCVACFESKRCEAPSLSQMPAHTCYFAPTWESVLAKYSITFEHQTAGPSDDQLEDPIFGLKIDSPALLVQIGEDDLWRDVTYGTPLTARDFDPNSVARQKLRMLFGLLDDMRAGDPEDEDDATDAYSDTSSPSDPIVGGSPVY